MRVLVNMPSQHGTHPSGVARVTFSLLQEWLAGEDHSFILRSPWRREDLPEGLRNSRLEVVVTPRPRHMLADVLMQTFRLPGQCRRMGVDVVFNADPFGSRTGAAARVTLVHDLYFKSVPGQIGSRACLTMGLAYSWVLAGTTRIVTVSDATRTDLENWRADFGRRAVTIHSDATPLPKNLPKTRLIDAPYVLMVGNATPNKNFRFAAQALSRLSCRFPTLNLVHVGGDAGEIIKAELEVLGSRLILHRRTRVSDVDLAVLYRDAACLLVPSLAEGFCLPILEAQDAGCPVVHANVSAMPEIAGEGGLKYPEGDQMALADLIARLLTDADHRSDVIARGHTNRRRFSWHEAGRAYLGVFQDALSDARKHS